MAHATSSTHSVSRKHVREDCSPRDSSGGGLALIISVLSHLPFSSSPTRRQVLSLQRLNMTFGETYVVQWEVLGERFDCYPEDNADEAKCKARGCIWKVRGDTHYTLCFYFLSLNSQKENNSCNIWSAVLSVNIQPINIERVPHCFFPEDYGYMVKETEEHDTGMTVDIIRNNKYRSSGRPDSPDIDTLRVEIRYHSSDMLQFKVCICFRQWCM